MTPNSRIYFLSLLLAFLLTACGRTYTVPQNTKPTTQKLKIYPDYTNIVIPPNIAPLNFMVRAVGDEFVAQIVAPSGKQIVSGSDETGIIRFDSVEWRNLLYSNKGQSLTATIYVKRGDQWYVYPSYYLQVAEEPIDPYLSYRLIEPGYELYRQLGLYQRNLTNFDVHIIYENNRTEDDKNSHCINCHNYQNYSTKRMLFHVRGNHGGTIIAENGKIEKSNPKNDSLMGNAVYPSWHPRRNWVVFSSNKTGQVFHIYNKNKIEVLDYGSDLIFYNADTHEVSNVLKTSSDWETFPCWAPSGDRIYYCVAHTSLIGDVSDSVTIPYAIQHYRDLRYNLMTMSFDEHTMTFGKPQLVYDCAAHGLSASVPRVSPDGKYLLFTLGKYGQFHIWHRSSDLYVKNLATGQVYPLRAANSSNVDSYHSWSSNGRWIAFSSRRDDGNFTRTYITYFDHQGHAHKAFMTPQEDPRFNLRLFKSFNVPELTRDAVPYESSQFRQVIYNTDPTICKYREIRSQHIGK